MTTTGTLLCLTAALCCGAATYLTVPASTPRGRLARLLPPPEPPPAPPRDRDARRRWAVAGLAGLVSALFLGGPVGWAAGILVAVVCARVLSRLEPRAVRLRRARIVADLPMAIDLLAACLRGGGAWPESVEAVADAVGGPLGTELTRVAARVRLGADPAEEWLGLAATDPILAPLGRAAARAATGGAPVAATLARLAQDQRRTARAAASARARTAGVRAVAPLGLCFLPAFILLGIVPAVAGIASNVLLP